MLQGPDEPQRVMVVAVDGEDGVDDVLEGSGAGDGAVFGDVTDEQRRERGLLRELDERLRALADLGDAAGCAGPVGVDDGLDRIDGDDVGTVLGDDGEDSGKRRVGGQAQLGVERVDPSRSESDLLG